MNCRTSVLIAGVLAWLGLTQAVLGQTAILGAEPQGTVNVTLEPLGASGNGTGRPLFAVADPLGAASPGVIKADLGFMFLQPVLSNRSISLTVPSHGDTVLGSTGNFTDHFVFVPRVNASYQFGDLGFGVAASGTLMHLSESLNRQAATTPDGTATINAQGSIDIATANVLEGTKAFDLGESECFCKTCLQDTIVTFSLGGRYAYVHQNYSATLVVGTEQSTLTTNQEFTGFGITSSVGTLTQLFGDFAFYSITRGSLLIGTDNRTASLAVVAPGGVGNNLVDDRTTVVPELEWDIGIAYGLELAKVHMGPPPPAGPLMWVKAGFVGQLWGDIGLLNINSVGASRFSDSHLLLLGFTVQLGIEY